MNRLIISLEEKLHKGIVSFVYLKKDGSRRNANGTLYGIGHTIKGNGGRSCKWTLNYYDVDCQDWRSFLIENLISVGEVRQKTAEEHHDICIALIVKLKEKMRKKGITAFAYRNKDGSIFYTHGVLSDGIDKEKRIFTYFDTDKREEITFEIDDFIGIGERIDIANMLSFANESKTNSKHYNEFSSLDIKTILANKGIKIKDTENFMVIDLLPEMNKEQLKNLIIKATERLANL